MEMTGGRIDTRNMDYVLERHCTIGVHCFSVDTNQAPMASIVKKYQGVPPGPPRLPRRTDAGYLNGRHGVYTRE
jgi:hypothetical protein